MKKPFVFRAFIIALLRRGTHRYPPRNEVLREARISRGKYKCASCCNEYRRMDIAVDHIDPVVPETGFPLHPDGTDNYDIYVKRMYPKKEGFQVLCNECHNKKSASEQTQRAKVRREKKVKK